MPRYVAVGSLAKELAPARLISADPRNGTHLVGSSIAAAFRLFGGHAIVLSDTTLASDENGGSGLWLWHGKAPLPPSQSASRVQQIPGPNVSALRRGGWWALLGGVALALLAVMQRSTSLDQPPPVDTPAVALDPVPSPTNAHAVISAPPVDIPPPQVEHTDTELNQAPIPSVPAAPLPARGTEHELATKAVHHTSTRTVRKAHALAARNSPVIRGVLMPPDPVGKHNGGH